MNEATARIKINNLLEAAGWHFFADGNKPANICLETGVTILGELTSLDVLHLRGNALTGSFPVRLGSLSDLGWLDVAENALTGMLPPALGSLSTLRALSLSGNRLTGPLPSELTMLPELDYLWIDETGLCAPADATFQTWLAALMQFSGVTCLDFAHFANGTGIISDLVLMNVALHIPVRPRPLLLRPGRPSHRPGIDGGSHGRSRGHRGRSPDRSDGNGTAGKTHDFYPWPGGSGERIGAGGLRRSHRRGPAL